MEKVVLSVLFQDLLDHKEREVTKVYQVQWDHRGEKVARAYQGRRDQLDSQVQKTLMKPETP